MNIPTPRDMPVVDYGFHRGRSAVDRGAVLIALIASAVVGVTAGQGLDSIAIGVVVGATLFAMLAPLMAAAR